MENTLNISREKFREKFFNSGVYSFLNNPSLSINGEMSSKRGKLFKTTTTPTGLILFKTE